MEILFIIDPPIDFCHFILVLTSIKVVFLTACIASVELLGVVTTLGVDCPCLIADHGSGIAVGPGRVSNPEGKIEAETSN